VSFFGQRRVRRLRSPVALSADHPGEGWTIAIADLHHKLVREMESPAESGLQPRHEDENYAGDLRRRAKPNMPPAAKIKPGSPAPTMGPGTGLRTILSTLIGVPSAVLTPIRKSSMRGVGPAKVLKPPPLSTVPVTRNASKPLLNPLKT
jgi:hypothetical protein